MPSKTPATALRMTPEFSLRYSQLPARFFERATPTPVQMPRLIGFNEPLAAELGFDVAAVLARPDDATAVFAGNVVPPGAEPVAQAYAGHQFGSFVPTLGDGRAILLGEVRDTHGQLRDLQLKGAGRTPFSRRGDGRAPLGPVLREYVVSEAMHAMGIPTTRSLAAVATGEPVYRETALPGGVLTRVAASHIRVGTFEYFAARGDIEGLRTLADHVIERHYPHLADVAEGERYLALLDAVQTRQAALVARWMGVGFIHGVMNTDNTTVSGETLDFGPCAFIEAYDPRAVFSSIDEAGRYAYGNQPGIVQWNMARLAETLLPLIHADSNEAVERASASIHRFADQYHAAWQATMRAKLGLQEHRDDDGDLIQALLDAMHAGGADFTLTFRRLTDCAASAEAEGAFVGLFGNPQEAMAWLALWRARLEEEPGAARAAEQMRAVNPIYIPRNHRVEQMITAAMAGDYAPFDALNEVLARPFEEQPGREEYEKPADPHEQVTRTFCGT